MHHYKGAKCLQSLYPCQCPACRCQAVQLEHVSLETRLKQLQQLKIPDLFWQLVPCQWCSHGERTFSEICLSPDNDEVTVHGR